MTSQCKNSETFWTLLAPITVMLYLAVIGMVLLAIAKGFGYFAGIFNLSG